MAISTQKQALSSDQSSERAANEPRAAGRGGPVQLRGMDYQSQRSALSPGGEGYDAQSSALQPSAASHSAASVQLQGGGGARQLGVSALGSSTGALVQHHGGGGDAASIHSAAAQGTSGGSGELPHRAAIERSFGADLGQVQAHTDGAAAAANRSMGSQAYASGDHVSFGSASPSLHLAAHEAAHVVQQRSGKVQLSGGVGSAGDQYEKQADAAADAVVQGRSASPALGEYMKSSADTAAVQQQRVQHKGPDLTAERAKVSKKVTTGWYDNVVDYAQSLARWNSKNWTKFISACGGNYYVSWTSGQFQNAMAAVASTVMGLAAGSTAVLGAIVGTAVCPGVGTVVGAVVGFLASLIIGGIMTIMGNNAAMAAVDSALRQAGKDITEKNDEFDGQFDKSKAGARKERDNALAGIAKAGTAEELKGWENWADGEAAKVSTKINTSDTTLYDKLLKDWVLQHSGDEEDQNKETNSASYDANKKEVFGLDKNANLARKDLFLHQTKYEWGRMGLDSAWAIKDLEKKFKSWQYTSASQVGSGKNYGFHGDKYNFTKSVNPKLTIAKINNDYGHGDKSTCEEARQQIRNNDFDLVCELDVATADGACYMDHYKYSIDLKKPMPSPYRQTGSWSVSPD